MHYISNAEQMIPNLEPVELSDPLPNVTTMNVVELFVFTLGNLKHAACSKARAWRPLGYVQQLKSNLQSDKRKLCSSGKARNYHAQLQAMLKSLQHVQTEYT
jgi:hypothetical protein